MLEIFLGHERASALLVASKDGVFVVVQLFHEFGPVLLFDLDKLMIYISFIASIIEYF